MRKMEHRSWSTWSHGNDATGRSAEPHSLAKALVGSQKPLWRLYLGELMLWFILGRSKMISTPFFHQKCAKWNTDDGAGGAGGATETRPWEAPRSFGSGARGQEHALGAAQELQQDLQN